MSHALRFRSSALRPLFVRTLLYLHAAGFFANAYAQSPSTWRLTPMARAKALSVELTRVVAMTAGRDGSVIVADQGSQSILIIDSSGRHVRTLGRIGRGPGEFTGLRNIGFLGDTIWAVDGGLRRVSMFTLDGSLLRTISRMAGESPEPARPASYASIATILRDGLALGVASGASPLSASSTGETSIVLMMRDGRIVDTLASMGLSAVRPSQAFQRGALLIAQRFSDAPLVVFAQQIEAFYVVFRSVAASSARAHFQVMSINSKGDTLWNKAFAYTPRKLERTSADSFVSAIRNVFSKAGMTASDERLAEVAFIPTYRPPVTSGFAAADGTLWLRREEGGPHVHYTVIGRTGDLLGELRLPQGVRLYSVSQTVVWGVEIDSDDVPTVVRFELGK